VRRVDIEVDVDTIGIAIVASVVLPPGASQAVARDSDSRATFAHPHEQRR
jgi:hypothetical protein